MAWRGTSPSSEFVSGDVDTGYGKVADAFRRNLSSGKEIGAAVAVAASRGLIDYDALVADYWAEFAQAGKEAITVRQLLSHQAGLVAIKPMLTLAEIADPERLSARIASQVPAWPPGTRHGYHAVTLGWYEGELIRRVDPQPPDAGPVPRRRARWATRIGLLHRVARLS